MYTDLLRDHSLRSGIPPDVQMLILQCATHATRPLRLLEVAEMLETTYFSRTEKDLTATKDIVRAACGPLLEIQPDETIRVIHHSFTEYLTGTTRSDRSVDYPVLKPGPTHKILALACLSYLESGCLSHVKERKQGAKRRYSATYDIEPSDDEPRLGEFELRLQYPFFEYATSNWHVHVIKSIKAGYDQEEVNKALRRFFDDGERLNTWLKQSWHGHKYCLDGVPLGAAEHGLNGVTQLHIAAELGLEPYIRELLQMGYIDVNAQDEVGRTPLWWAAWSGHAGVVRLLAQAGANPDQDDNYNGLKPLHKAVSVNHAEVVRVLLETGVSPMTGKSKEEPDVWCGTSPGTTGDTPLMYACRDGHLETVDAFLSFVTDPDIVRRALGWAAEAGRSAIVRRILQHPNADVNAIEGGVTPLFQACKSLSEDTILALLEAGADPNVYSILDSDMLSFRRPDSDYGRSPLYKLCTAAARRGDPHNNTLQTIFSLLVNAGVNVHQREADGSNALHWAVNSPILTRLLLDAGVDANATSSDGATPLHKAKRIEVMCLLITSGGADINKRDKEGKTPLLSRFMDRFHGTADLDRFLEFGPDCSVVDNEGNSVLHYLLQDANHREVTSSLRNLLAMGADPNCRNYSGDLPLHRIWPDPKVPDQILDLLLAAGVDMNARDKQGATLLFRVIWSQFDKSSAFIELLLEKGASLAVRDFQGRTLLHEAIKKGSVPAGLEFLLARGLDPSAVDNYGNNLLHELAMRSCNYDFYGHQAMVGVWKQLLSLGLDLSQRNYTGRTPLHILCCSQIQFKTFKPSVMLPIDFVISEMKTSGGMTVDVVDNAGITPLHLAATISGIYAQKLLDAGADPTRATMEGRTSLHLAAQSRASNIVGILLDGLYRRQMTEALPTGNLIDKTIAVLPRGSWYREKTFQFSARAINAQDAPRPSPVGKSGWTPLSYACRSGRPETVALLLKAGAEVTFGRLVEACVGFEQEQSLWNRDHQRGEDLDTGGLRFADSSRPSVSDGNFPDLNTQTARIDEILEMLLEKGMEFDTVEGVSHKYHNYHNYLTDTAFKDRRDYTVGCLATARALQNEYKKGMGQKSGANTYAMHQRRCVQEAALRSLTDFEGLKKGEGNEALFLSLIIRRDYSVVRELSRAGADFFQQGLERRSNNFGVLASLGFASLAESIIRDLCAKSKASDKEEIKQAQSCSSLPNMTFRSYDPSDHSKNASHLLMAVRRALPNMEMVRLLVEDCGVDINELHIGSDGNITDSPLLSVAKGEQWWHAALAVPYFIGQSANLNIRNYHGQTPLHIALREGNNGSCGFFRNDVVRALVKAGADVNATDTQGRSCLAYAGRDTTLVRLLIENGAKVSPHALFAAIDSNNYEVLQTLLSAGADPNMRRPEVGNPPKAQSRIAEGQLFAVQHAAKTHEIEGWYRLRAEEKAVLNGVRVKMVETLLAYGADPFATFLQRLIFGDVNYKKQCEEWTAFILKSNDPHLSEPHTVTARTRVMYEASKIPKGYEQCTILHDLVENDLMIEPFLQLTDLDVDHRDPKGRSLLLSACNSRNGPDTLIEIPPSHVEESGSASAASQSILRYLLSRGADPLARDNEGRNALHQMLDGIEKKQNYGWKDSLSYMAKTYPTLVDQMDKWGKTPLHLALQLATRRVVGTELVVTFLRAGADPLLTDGEGNSSLHILAHGLDRPAVRELFEDLLNRGCDINARNIHGETPLGSSRYFRRRTHPKDSNGVRNDVGQKSLWETSGADISIFDNAGRGFLHLAARETATRLQEPMQRGLDPMMEDENRQTPLDVAAASGNKNIFALFERKRE